MYTAFPGRAGPAPVGLALGGGGLRGTAHIGVLKVMLANGIRPAMIAGTSAGSIIAALYAAGRDPADLERLALSVKASDLYDPIHALTGLRMAAKLAHDYLGIPLAEPPAAPLGFVRGDRLERFMEQATGGATFTQTRLPLAITAVDINTGQLVIFCAARDVFPDVSGRIAFITDATLAEAMRASTAIPGVFEPKRIRGRTLVDGGVKDLVPADVLRLMGAERVIAVDLGLADRRRAEIDDIVEVMQQAVDIMGRELTDILLRRSAAVVIAPRTGDVGLADLHRIPELIARGEEAARAAIWRVRALVG